MKKAGATKKALRCYIAWFIFMLFVSYMLILTFTCDWAAWTKAYIPCVIVLFSYATFDKRVKEKAHSYLLAVVSMANIFIYSYMQQELYSAILVISGLAILLAVYMDWIVILFVSVLSLLMVGVHAIFLQTVSMTTLEEALGFAMRVVVMLYSEIFLIFFVHRLYSAEKSLKASVEEARNAEHSKSDFLANMSHEIRTPMNAIVGMCELILRDDINDDVRENCFSIQNSGRSLLAIINDILDFSKIESGKAELIEDEFNIGSTINDVMNMAITRKGDKKLEIIARVDPTIPKGLIGDEVRIKQVIVNLITNAVKFTNRGCIILKITQNRHDYGINLNVSVKDTGIGITEENLEKLFTSFQQVDTRKNRSVEGTGLGLAISKRLVTKMGGFVNVSSTYGEGSEFKFVIPLRVSDPEPFIHVNNTAAVNVAVYIDMKKYNHAKIERAYRKLIYELGEKFRIRFTLFHTAKELKDGLQTGDYTHCFTAKEEYAADKEFFGEIAETLEVLVIQDRTSAIALPSRIKCIYKPFYALSVAAALNNEKHIFGLNYKNSSAFRFTAPDAKVLIVDDNITNLKVAEGLMKPYNMRIVTAMSGRDAIEAMRTQDYDLVFMDHMMPEMDGVEATKIIRGMQGEYYKNVPIIALTANAVNGVREMFLREGFNDFIAKPIELSLLDRALKAWLPKERIISYSSELAEEEAEQSVSNTAEQVEVLSGAMIDFVKGMYFTGGNKAVYLEVLKTYTKSGAQCRESLEQRFAKEDWEKYVVEVHALKSSSMSIGAESLSELAKALEFAGKDKHYGLIKERHAELSQMYGEVLEEAKEYLQVNGISLQDTAESEKQSAGKAISAEEFERYMESIRKACEEFDGDAIVAAAVELCECSLKGVSLRQYFTEVKGLAEDFEYEQALEAAEKAAAAAVNL